MGSQLLRSMKFEHFTRYYLYLRGSIEFVVVFCIRPTALAIFVSLPVNKELEPVNLERKCLKQKVYLDALTGKELPTSLVCFVACQQGTEGVFEQTTYETFGSKRVWRLFWLQECVLI